MGNLWRLYRVNLLDLNLDATASTTFIQIDIILMSMRLTEIPVHRTMTVIRIVPIIDLF